MTAPTRRQRRAMVVLLVISLMLVTLDYRSDSFAGIRSATQTVFGPVQRGLTAVFAPVGRFFAAVPDAAGSRARIEALQRENAELRRKLLESSVNGTRAEELRRLELLAGLGGYRVVPATVVALGPSLGFEWTVTVDDPTTWTRPWTFGMRLTMDDREPVLEFACHEGNYAVPNILSAARAVERDRANAAKKQ